MRRLDYPRGVLLGDALRGIAGLAFIAVVLVAVDPALWLAGVLVVIAAVFALFALRALLRTRECYVLGPDALEVRHRGATLPWCRLVALELSYFSTRRDHRHGWLELKLGFDDDTVRVDSRLNGFEPLLERAHTAARDARLTLGGSTLRNLQWLGKIDLGERGVAADA